MVSELLNQSYGWTRDAGVAAPEESANLVSSRMRAESPSDDELHYILLDLDGIKAEIVPSSTPGNSHLYIYHAVTKEQLNRVVDVLTDIGLLQEGIRRGWRERGILCLRKPGVMKPIPPEAGALSEPSIAQ